MAVKWAYGVTTVPERRGDLLPATLASLKAAGFDEPRLLVDGDRDYLLIDEYKKFGLEVTIRHPRIRTFANWFLTLWELYLREPLMDRYGVFQDDFVTYANLREYLNSCKYPDKGYWNLYTFPINQALAPADDSIGWYRSNQMGKGGVALVFDRKTVTTLLSSKYMVARPQDARGGWKSVDGAIVTALKNEGWSEFVHNPSLIQHTGLISSMGGRHHPLSPSFKGEQYDARELICQTTA